MTPLFRPLILAFVMAVSMVQAQPADQAAVIAEHRQQLFADDQAPVLGNPQGDVTIVEFFDYNCGFCRRNLPAIEALIDNDPQLRVVLREWPILGEDSVAVSGVSLAAAKQGKYAEFHHKMMMRRGKGNAETALQVAAETGLDMTRLQHDQNDPAIAAHLRGSLMLGRALEMVGTPTWVIGDRVIFGYLSQAELAEIIAEERGGR